MSVSKSIAEELVGQISWGHNFVILDRCEDDLERESYLRMTRYIPCSPWSAHLGHKVLSYPDDMSTWSTAWS
ncbi:MAG: DUF1016 domain-containing protein [bacterium]|nr:DUF1016 domain-containing protein [bacterium]